MINRRATQEKQEAFRFFLDKMKDGSLEIRKTLQLNHAKLYIFENKEEFSRGDEYPVTVIQDRAISQGRE